MEKGQATLRAASSSTSSSFLPLNGSLKPGPARGFTQRTPAEPVLAELPDPCPRPSSEKRLLLLPHPQSVSQNRLLQESGPLVAQCFEAPPGALLGCAFPWHQSLVWICPPSHRVSAIPRLLQFPHTKPLHEAYPTNTGGAVIPIQAEFLPVCIRATLELALSCRGGERLSAPQLQVRHPESVLAGAISQKGN